MSDLQSNRSSYARGLSTDLQSNRSSFVRRVSILSSARSEVSFAESHSTPFLQDIEEDANVGFSRFLLGDDFEKGELKKKKRTVGTPMVVCRVCNHHIPLDGYDLEEHYIVKCTVCKEATPIRAAPSGERYVRCVCNCLLICRKTAKQVACPR
ncbi:hypothetical protein RvY_17987-1 [Ramazzottius varieornatus]|uniref:Phosphatidylinositol-4,5-bisphosphate 4-phosphatase n=1 Tax=Ramazzottius varieornatus TaxID=947166 RepID=A0A1D1W449_RAMVA|nr:hypothetical protein RvY_17987-1 [Ramazzottius varieornatus]